MAAINKHQNNKTINLTFNQHINPVPQISNAPKHRNIFTAKLKSRALLASEKTFKLTSKMSSFHNQPTPSLQQKQIKNQQILNESTMNQFQDLNLQDFLKVVIVGKNKLSQAKSKQIIRSLNGTWFRNTQAIHPLSRLYCSLPIKKQKSALLSKNKQELVIKPNINDQFYRDYTPPNLFPKRKISPVKITSPLVRKDYIQSNKQILKGQEIKGKILKKFTLLRQKTPESRNKRRSSSHFSRNRSNVSNIFEDSGCLMGKKMVIHND